MGKMQKISKRKMKNHNDMEREFIRLMAICHNKTKEEVIEHFADDFAEMWDSTLSKVDDEEIENLLH